MSYTFRLATTADIPAVTRIVNAAYRVEDFFKIGDRTDEGEVGRIIRDHAFIVAVDEAGDLAGCVEVRAEAGRGYFGMLSVDPGRQKAGLGAALVAEAERFAIERGCGAMDITYVNVREELTAFYRRFGYQKTGTAPFPAEEPTKFPVHFVTMSKELTGAAVESRAV